VSLLREERAYKAMELDAEAAREMERAGIKTDYWRKPIPTNACDWSAYRDGYEPGDSIGYGATEEEAIQDLLEQEEE
jgi:hypothetical protein